ncbi:type IV pilus twitching motility protein PilT [Chloroflexota bacterium]
MDIDELLARAIEMSASDLHLNVGSEPVLRIDGRLKKFPDLPPVTDEDAIAALERVTTRAQRDRFFEEKELDFSYQLPELGRHRVNVLIQKGVISIAFRLLSSVLSPLESLGLPPIFGEMSLKPRGLILVTGPTGSGKSTSMAAMIKHINERQERHIITIEDPIEYVHENIKSLILQRNVGEDTVSFSEALRRALRHDPDVIVIGEMRDLTTIATAISAAETGHLVLGTLHTLDAPETINRIVDVFPPEQQSQITLQLSQVLIAVLSQTLVPCIGGGRAPACEIMITNAAIKNVIRQKQIHMLHGIMEVSSKDGMQTLNQSLARLVRQGLLSESEALAKSSDTEQLGELVHKMSGQMAYQR